MNFNIIVFAFFSVFLVNGQAFASVESCVNNQFARDFFKKYSNERASDFPQYSIEQQYNIFLYGHQCSHPPLTESAELLALNGERVIDLLKDKIIETDKGTLTVHLISVFYHMNQNHIYNVASDDDLVAFLQSTIRNMNNELWKPNAQQYMDAIISTGMGRGQKNR